ncbi:MAG: O-antigen ligase family protein [Paraclostridium sp.]|uniref:O-antigen ligase family protein n=1 Tax=Paraclostridium sp. TaxID=2023273 RepID=UPI003F3876B6
MNLSKNFRASDERLIIYLMILTPFIDLLNGVFDQILITNISPGILIRSCILILIMYIYVIQKKENLIKLIFIISLFLFQMLILNFSYNIRIHDEISFISKIYYNMFLFFIIYDLAKRHRINFECYIDKLVFVNIVVTISLVITKIIGLGEGAYDNGIGFRGLYIGLNDLTAVCIITFPFLLYKLIIENKKIKYGIFTIISALSIINIGTKTSIIILGVILIFFICEIIFKDKRIGNKFIFAIAIVILIVIFKRFFWDEYSSTILTRLQYFRETLDFKTFLVSGRNVTLRTAFDFWDDSVFNFLFGTGFTRGSFFIGSFLEGHGMIEMDFFDILYFYGVIMFLMIFIPLLKAMIKSIYIFMKSNILIYKVISLMYLITIMISFLGGHILLSPLAGIYFVVVYGMISQINLREETYEKSISDRS